MSTHFAASFSNDATTVFLNGKLYTADRDHPNFDAINKVIRNGEDPNQLPALFDLTNAVADWAGESGMTIRNSWVYYKDEPLSDTVTEKILRMIESGHAVSSLANFMDNVQENPSYASRNELLMFMDANRFLIDEDGYVIAFKAVREDYYDLYSNSFLNTVGTVHSMDRGKVDDDRTRTCSTGFHFAALEYALGFGGYATRLMVIRVHPRDVVSIPNDYDNQKGRCCRYEVIGEVEDPEWANKIAYESEVVPGTDGLQGYGGLAGWVADIFGMPDADDPFDYDDDEQEDGWSV